MNFPIAPDKVSSARRGWEVFLLMLIFFVHAGDAPPGINEAHYLCKAKHYWDSSWCSNDLFVTSGKAHVVYYMTVGWLTQITSLSVTAWAGRIAGWLMIAWALQRLCWRISPQPYLSLLAAIVWIVGVEQGDLAGEWVVGGTEAKVFAYGFVLIAMHEIACARWRYVWPLLGAASAMHVLVGGWSVIAAGVAFVGLGQTRTWKSQLVPLAIGGAVALLGVVPGLSTMQGVEPAQAQEAASIYTYERIAHHLYPAAFSGRRIAGHLVLLGVTAMLAFPLRRDERLKPVLWFAAGCVGIALGGCLLGMLPAVAPDLAARLLRYYWFRMTDSIVPLALALCLIAWTREQFSWPARRSIVTIVSGIHVLLFASMFLQRMQVPVADACRQSLLSFDHDKPSEHQIRVYNDWISVCGWIQDNTHPDDVFLTPRHQQSFKWFANRAEVVNWKDVPQDAASMLQWRDRIDDVFPKRLGGVRVTIRYDRLKEYRERYGAKYLLVDQRINPGNLPLVQLYPEFDDSNKTFRVYQLPHAYMQ